MALLGGGGQARAARGEDLKLTSILIQEVVFGADQEVTVEQPCGVRIMTVRCPQRNFADDL